MHLDVGDGMARVCGKGLCRTDLVGDQAFDLAGAERNDAAAETPEVRETRVRTYRNPTFPGQCEGLRHDLRVAGMQAAGDIGGADDIQDGFVVAHAIGAVSLAHVGVEVDAQGCCILSGHGRACM
ncbi:hypothetical protein D3C72_1839220 [compost metagenome]